MSLYVIPLLVLLIVVLFVRRANKRKKTGPSEEEYLAQVLQDVKQTKEQQVDAEEEAKPQQKRAETPVTPVKPQQPSPTHKLAEQSVEQTQAPKQAHKALPETAPATTPKAPKRKAPTKQRFTPYNPLIEKYETHLNLEMLRAQKAGDENAYIDIARQSAVYMKNCTILKKAMADKDKGKALEALKKIREMIPKDFRPE